MQQIDDNELKIILDQLGLILKNEIQGEIVEFGCYMGDTSVKIAEKLKNTDRKLYLYDSFEGLPEKTSDDKSALGADFVEGELFASKKALTIRLKKLGAKINFRNVRVKKAWFNDLTDKDVPEKIAFAFLDGDYYASIKDSFRVITDKLADQAIIVVDDYDNSALPGTKIAVDEWLKENPTARLTRVEKSLGVILFSR